MQSSDTSATYTEAENNKEEPTQCSLIVMVLFSLL